MKSLSSSNHLKKNYFFLNIAFILSALFIFIGGNWSINTNKESLQRVYSFRLFSRGHFQVITANTKAMNFLNLGFKNSNQEQLVEGITHLETSLGFIYSLQSELDMDNVNSDLDKLIPRFEALIELYETLLDRKLNSSDNAIREEINVELTELNKIFGHAESNFWIKRAKEFENIRRRNVLFERIYWILVGSFTLGVVILVYLTQERAKLENELENQKIQMVSNSRLAALGQFSASVAHEINNPLTVILWRLKSLRGKAQERGLDQRSLKELQSIEDNSNRIDNIIKGIKTLSYNADSDKFSKISIQDIKTQLEDILTPKLELLEMNYQFTSTCFERTILAREVQIIQVLVNLINNSVDAISSLPQKWVNINSYTENQNVVFTITDSGDGIPKENRNQLFDLFFTTKSKENKGTGIGLALASQIIKNHKGSLTYNASCKNTQFIIRIPLAT
ncbi:sensor histidine kinase [Halobacteriovorax sp. HLS]|uniref:sensor histidine kinase n=1 Tax=Halobacteriovorax sp. HLS TaxID=2234000 RepID=UPI000FD715F3|nr:ATP-binding protein [Halobacteriovorax sp. HLS]